MRILGASSRWHLRCHRSRSTSDEIGTECGEAFRRLPPHLFAESVNSEGGHLVLKEMPGKESEPGTEINFLGRNFRGVPAFANPIASKTWERSRRSSRDGDLAMHHRHESMRVDRFKSLVGMSRRIARLSSHDPAALPTLHRADGPLKKYGALLCHGDFRDSVWRALPGSPMGPHRLGRTVACPPFRM